MRTELLQAITGAVSTLTQFAVSQELPWSQNGTALYLKNMKKIYVDQERRQESTLIPTLDGRDVFQDDLISQVYLAVDAKNPPSQTAQAVSQILGTKSKTSLVNFGSESDYTIETQDDVLIYTFEFRMNTITL
jgi:hypothetical protein